MGGGLGFRSVGGEKDGSVRSSDGPGGRVEQGVGDGRSLEKRCGWGRTQGQRGACCRCHHRSHRQGAGEQATRQGLGQLLGESQRALQGGEGRGKREVRQRLANPTSPQAGPHRLLPPVPSLPLTRPNSPAPRPHRQLPGAPRLLVTAQ